MKRKIIAALLMLTILLTGCAENSESSSESVENVAEQNVESQNEETTQDEEPYVLTFEGITIDGEVLTSDCFADSKLTMINVWATYCNPCLAEMPDLGEIAASYDTADFQILGVISDVPDTATEEELQTAKDLINETGADYPHLVLNESLYVNLIGGVEAVPTTFFVNQKGEALGYLVGSQSKESWEEVINGLLEEME